MTESGIAAVITMEREIEIYKALIENILIGRMEAGYKDDPDNALDAEGIKSVKKMLKENKYTSLVEGREDV
jgi:hypothetical protein